MCPPLPAAALLCAVREGGLEGRGFFLLLFCSSPPPPLWGYGTGVAEAGGATQPWDIAACPCDYHLRPVKERPMPLQMA